MGNQEIKFDIAETIVYYDGPKLLSAHNKDETWLLLWRDNIDNTELWLAIKATQHDINKLVKEEDTLYNTIKNSNKLFFFKIKDYSNVNIVIANDIQNIVFKDIPKDCLPHKDVFLFGKNMVKKEK